MKIKQYLELKSELQRMILSFIDDETSIAELEYEKSIAFIKENKYAEDPKELKILLYFLSRVALNHNRRQNFFSKIGKFIIYFEKEIKQTFTNLEIYKIFQKNQPILLFHLKNEILKFDEEIISLITNKKDTINMEFFKPEIEGKTDIENYEENRQIGENDSYICSLIRNDSVEDFITFVNSKNICLENYIKLSIFETNYFLQKQKKISLIEYAAFFGSIQIFNYLKFNNVELNPSLWLYIIHGNNPEMIHILEENNIKPDETFEKCVKESIKCHHNDIANYLLINVMSEKNIEFRIEKIFFKNTISYGFHYHNYEILINNYNEKYFFYYACKYDYYNIVEHYIMNEKIDINLPAIKKYSFLKCNSKFFFN